MHAGKQFFQEGESVRKRTIENMEEVLCEIREHHFWELASFFPEIDFYSMEKRRGGYYYINCPFHEDKSPSCCYMPSSGIIHCFGCGNFTGDIIEFYRKLRRKSFFASVIRLAKFFGIKIVWKTTNRTL